MKFKVIILIFFSTSFHSEPAPFCVGFSVRSRKHYEFPFAYVNVNIIKKIIS